MVTPATTDKAAPADRTLHFHPISGARAHEEVIDQVTFAIRAGIFRPGDRLPSVEELARLMGVSKPVIGEAIKVLSSGGVLIAQRGASGGVTVASDEIPVTLMRVSAGTREAALTELVEARRPIEMEIAVLASQRATGEDFETMQFAIDRYSEAIKENSPAMRLRADHLFHYAMGRAARTEMLARYQHEILEQLAIVLEEYYAHDEDPQLVLETHGETLDAIRSRDAERVRVVMARHLENLENLARSWEAARPG
jgi:GntR family transcriptional regulator, transcriptional repressor for pyruvate dehydrogenase complex